MNKQERDELRQSIPISGYYRTELQDSVLDLLDLLDAYESVVEAAREFVDFKGRNGSMEHVLLYSDLVTEVEALEGLEDED